MTARTYDEAPWLMSCSFSSVVFCVRKRGARSCACARREGEGGGGSGVFKDSAPRGETRPHIERAHLEPNLYARGRAVHEHVVEEGGGQRALAVGRLRRVQGAELEAVGLRLDKEITANLVKGHEHLPQAPDIAAHSA